MTSKPPVTLDDLRRITNPITRAAAVGDYLKRLDQAAKDARHLRRQAIAAALPEDPKRAAQPTQLARDCAVSLSLVKNIRDGKDLTVQLKPAQIDGGAPTAPPEGDGPGTAGDLVSEPPEHIA